MTSSEYSFLARTIGSIVDSTIMSVHLARAVTAALQSAEELPKSAYEKCY